ncbi:hypothetical protein [Prosthecochloris sp.]|uniref:hypothetical protein n=1 Tax=Prosthecochloris sp. TaxID=290513 RepID=UPI0025E1863C|nr:hypothetical protein [Prosthecochloris sp.]
MSGKDRIRFEERISAYFDALVAEVAEAVILGCKEIGMLVNQVDTDVKLFDTTAIHAEKAVEYAIGDITS